MADCTYVYFDHFGRQSAVYAHAKADVGADLAEEIYIRHMFETGKFKFRMGDKKVTPKIEELDEFNNDLVRAEKSYASLSTSNPYDTVSFTVDHLIHAKIDRQKVSGGLFFSDFIPDEKKKTMEEKVDEAARAYVRTVIKIKDAVISQIVDPQLQEDAIDQAFYEDPELEEQWVDFIKNMWKSSQEYGVYIHHVIHRILQAVEKRRADLRARRNRGEELTGTLMLSDAAFIQGLNDRDLRKLIEKKLPREPKVLWRAGTAQRVKDVTKTIVSEIAKQETIWGIKKGDAIIRSEQKLKNDDMKMAGTADIVLINPGTNEVMIYDIKSKTIYQEDVFDEKGNPVREMRGSAFRFYSIVDELLGAPFEGSSATPFNKASAQLSYYAAMLERMGFRVNGAKVIFLESYQNISYKDVESQKDPSQATHSHTGLKTGENPIINASINPAAVYEYHTPGGDYNDMLEASREKGFYNIINEWTENQLSYAKDNKAAKEQWIINKYNRMRRNKKGQYTYRSSDPTLSKASTIITLTDEQYANEKVLKKTFETEWDNIQKDRRTVTTKVIDYFNNHKLGRKLFGDRTQAVANLLQDINPDEWELHIAQNFNYRLFGDLGPDVMIAVPKTNNNTNQVIFLSAIPGLNRSLHFEHDGGASNKASNQRSTMYGKYLTDWEVQGAGDIHPKVRFTTNTEFQVISMKLGVAAMRYRKEKGNIRVKYMRVGNIVGRDFVTSTSETMLYTSMENEMNKLEAFRIIMPEEDWNNDPTLKEIGEMLDDQDTSKPENYDSTFIDQLYHILESPPSRGLNSLTYINARNNEIGQIFIDQVRARREGKRNATELIKTLAEMRDMVDRSASLTGLDRAREKGLELVESAMHQVLEVEMDLDQIVSNTLKDSAFIRTGDLINDGIIQQAAMIRARYETLVNDKLRDFDMTHRSLISKLMKEAGGIAPWSSSALNVYKSLFKTYVPEVGDESLFPKGDEANWMTLRDPNDSYFNDKPAAKAYVIFFNKHVKEYLILSATNPNIRQGLKNGDFPTEGYIPIIESRSVHFNKDWIKNMWKAAAPKGRRYVKKNEIAQRMVVENPFETEITETAAGIQGSQQRRDKMGIDGDTERTLPKERIEIRLSTILHEVVAVGARVEFLGVLNTIIDSFLTSLMRIEAVHPHLTNLIYSQKYLRGWAQMVINNTVPDEGIIGKGLDKVSKMASQIIFYGAGRQVVTEFSTAFTQGISAFLSQEIATRIFNKKNPWFLGKDWIFALKAWGPEGNFKGGRWRTMAEECGLLFVDSQQLRDNNYTKHDRARAFRTEFGWAANTFPINDAQVQTLLAYAHHRGFHRTYVKQKNGRWKYDETIDPRFYVYKEGLGFGETKPPKTPEELRKHALWELYRNTISDEGMMGEDNRMKIPMYTEERQMIKNFTVRQFGSMSSDGVLIGDIFTVVRSMGRFKRWFAPRITNRYTRTMKMRAWTTQIYVEPEYNEDGSLKKKGYYVIREENYEGIYNTMGKLMAGFHKELRGGRKVELTEVQRDNLGKMIAEALLWFIYMSIAGMVYGSIYELAGKDNSMAKMFERSTGNALNELFFLGTLVGMTDNIFPAIASVMGSLQIGWAAAQASYQGDPERAWKNFTSAMGMAGLISTGQNVASVFVPND